MDLDKIIETRQSIRDYKEKDVDYKLIGEVIDTARKAPSSGNVQNWKFIIVKDQEKRNKIAKACLNQLWMAQAPVHIIICYDELNIKSLYPKQYQEFSIQNTAIAASFMMLKAVELKLGTCWVAVSDAFQISNILKLTPNIKPALIITLGYPTSDYHKKTRRYDIENICYFEEYGFAKKERSDATAFPLSKYPKKLQGKLKAKFKKGK